MGEQRLTDTAMRIYIYMLESNTPLSAREIARSLNIPVSTVSYYLKRFKDMGIVREAGGGYIVVRKIDRGIYLHRQQTNSKTTHIHLLLHRATHRRDNDIYKDVEYRYMDNTSTIINNNIPSNPPI
ncbi:transcriptional regulator, TrmB [Ignisphaera aggregans DSM 17230]|uniref:Transcriptional regulator, TrmB n=1 Tax=Ignisphaera aggregans (strain DSM 17230 / JCM 13409 / AQ1.S1) TaxID=583356 RepID=E0STQ9_IGNAA|nr:transcriptional regulator, TrmB [Ignisphaera aggregans DSM 17230]